MWSTGCGSDGPSDQLESAVADLEAATGGPPHASNTSNAETPAALVRRYFSLIDDKNFSEAWALVDPDLQEEFGGLESWRDGYSTSTSTSVLEANVESRESGETNLTVRIRSVDRCDGNRYTREFEGPVTIADGHLVEASFSQVSGDSLPTSC